MDVKTNRKKDRKTEDSFYRDSFAHLTDEMKRLDLLIQLEILAFRSKIPETPMGVGTQSPYISHQHVDWLLSCHNSQITTQQEVLEIRKKLQALEDEIKSKVTTSTAHGLFLSLPHLGHLFGLSSFELQTIMICLSPELDRKYDKLYAYLQDDITRKRPSIELVLNMLCEFPPDRWKARAMFSRHAPLFRNGILHVIDDFQSPSGSSDLARFLKLDPRIVNFLTGNTSLDERLFGIAQLHRPLSSLEDVPINPIIKTQVVQLTQQHFSKPPHDRKKLVFHFHGPYGVGKRNLALGVCGTVNCTMLDLDMEHLLTYESEIETLLRLTFREGLLLQAAVYLNNIDIVLTDEEKAKGYLKRLKKVVEEYGWLVFLAGETSWNQKGIFEQTVFQTVGLPIPDVAMRKAVWENALRTIHPGIEPTWVEQVANQFHLTPGQICDAAEWAQHTCLMTHGVENIELVDLYAACRQQSNQKLTKLAVKIKPHYAWDDLILPEDKITQLKEICLQVKYQYRVFNEWGFEEKLSHGKGLSVLFSGPPGTGKTMAAKIIAHDLHLDLYKIDLSALVSKYIGETEKNLAKIFDEAEKTHAILFFDEADALFGKRTDISDAHDRYANIETSYLLQKVEEYDGIIILASNLRENMDVAFTRRIRFIVEFPFPNVESRKKIWEAHFPSQAPVSTEVDVELLAQHVPIAGGNIKNIVLNAAFSAAANGHVITMEHILHGTKREFEKIGKRWDDKNVLSTQA